GTRIRRWSKVIISYLRIKVYALAQSSFVFGRPAFPGGSGVALGAGPRGRAEKKRNGFLGRDSQNRPWFPVERDCSVRCSWRSTCARSTSHRACHYSWRCSHAGGCAKHRSGG